MGDAKEKILKNKQNHKHLFQSLARASERNWFSLYSVLAALTQTLRNHEHASMLTCVKKHTIEPILLFPII